MFVYKNTHFILGHPVIIRFRIITDRQVSKYGIHTILPYFETYKFTWLAPNCSYMYCMCKQICLSNFKY